MLHFSPSLVVADLDGTMLHDANAFESRYLSQETVRASKRLNECGIPLAIITARPVGSAFDFIHDLNCLLYTSPSPRDRTRSRMPSSA